MSTTATLEPTRIRRDTNRVIGVSGRVTDFVTPPPRRRHVKKQVSIWISVSDWRTLRDVAANRGISITEILRRCMEPLLKYLRGLEPADISELRGLTDDDWGELLSWFDCDLEVVLDGEPFTDCR